MAGGGGTRLWPKSRAVLPKQFMCINSDRTLLQETYDRLLRVLDRQNIYIITNKIYVDEIHRELSGINSNNIIIECSPKNTAPAIALGLEKISKLNSSAVVGSFASDHLIKNEEEFTGVLKAAYSEASQTESIITIGILPTKADEGLGYIHVGADLKEVDKRPVFKVKRFTEKPTVSVAKAFVASGEYFWNASYFIAKAETFIRSYEKFLPGLWQSVAQYLKNNKDAGECWNNIDSMAIDYGIMEKADNLEMLTGDFGWSDIGNWSVVSEVFPASENGNVYIGDHEKIVTIDSKNCFIYGDKRLIATLGVSDLIIIDTKDAILITRKDRAHDVKNIVEKLKADNMKEFI